MSFKYDMPQGSFPGPIVFLLQRNDCPAYILGPDTVLIASVTNILIKTENEHNLNQKLNVNLKELQIWFCANGFMINTKKTGNIFSYFSE
jgi:hypothetical protein